MTSSLKRMSITLRCTVLFAICTSLLVAGTGMYLYRAIRTDQNHQATMLLSNRVDFYRTLLAKQLQIENIISNKVLFENVMGMEQDSLIMGYPDKEPLVYINPARIVFPRTPAVPAVRRIGPADIRTTRTFEGTEVKFTHAQIQVDQDRILNVTIAHVMKNENEVLSFYFSRVCGAILLTMFAIFIIGYSVMRHGLSPLRRIASQTLNITPTTLPFTIDDEDMPVELRGLSKALNTMLDRLNEGYNQIVRYSDDLAHEIRTPIGGILGASQVALYQERSGEEYRTLITSNMETLERMSRVVDNILFLARANNIQSVLKLTSFCTEAEMRRIQDYFEGLAEERDLVLKFSGTAELRADIMLFQRALSNLVVNAIAYADPGTSITVVSEMTVSGISVSVTNTGPHIPDDAAAKIFDRFYRMDNSRAGDGKSSGLGLSIVKAIMQLHGGTVTVKSVAREERYLTTFTLLFPLKG